ncbi:MAG: hypothetical protein RR397_04340 [Odoribacter sp.]
MLRIGSFQGKFREEGSVAEVEVVEAVKVSADKNVSAVERVRPEASFKIKDSLRQINTRREVKQASFEEEGLRLEAREHFDEEGVVEALERYLKDHRPDSTISIALKRHRPEVKEEKILITVDNPLQMDKLMAIRVCLQNVLMRYLNNGFLTLSFQMYDGATMQEEKKYFTAGEKLEHFMQLNPVVADLKVVFGLELE